MYHFVILRNWAYLQSLIRLMNTYNILKSKTKVDCSGCSMGFSSKTAMIGWSCKKVVFDLWCKQFRCIVF